MQFSTVAAPYYIPTNSVQGFQFLHILANTWLLFFYNSHPDRCEVISHCAFFIPLFIYLFYLFLAVLGLRFCARAFSSCSKRGTTLHRGARASHYRGLSCWGAQAPDAHSVVVAHGLSCSAACGIFPDQGSNLCPLHWQADSQPLRHQGSPHCAFDLRFLDD